MTDLVCALGPNGRSAGGIDDLTSDDRAEVEAFASFLRYAGRPDANDWPRHDRHVAVWAVLETSPWPGHDRHVHRRELDLEEKHDRRAT